MEKYDFSGWATRANMKCSDGRIIMKDAFKHNDGQTVPLVFNHSHNSPFDVLGHALLENREEGVYAYCKFNDSESGKTAKLLVQHGDVSQLSIYANQLKQNMNCVSHGNIRELSLVLAGANPGAYIDNVSLAHGEESDEEAIIYTGEDLVLSHSDTDEKDVSGLVDNPEDLEHSDTDEKDVSGLVDNPEDLEHSDKSEDETKKEKTMQDILDEMTEEQKEVMYVFVTEAIEHYKENKENKEDGGDDSMKHNVFDQDTTQDSALAHAEILNDAIADAKRYGSLKESIIQHAAANNITDIDELFPDAKLLTNTPEWIKENDDWVNHIMNSMKHTPFSRVKALFAKMDEAEARARGYIKGNEKKDLKLAVLKRTTQPTTVYVKMKMDRDDIVDISYDVVPWIRSEMRNQLNHEIARAALIGDGRDLSSEDKIDEQCIRPILTDDDMYAIKYTVTDGTDYHNDFNSASENDSEAKGIIRAAIKSRKQYKGSGNPTFYTTEDTLTELLLIEDQNGRRLYDSVGAVATAMRVKDIVTVSDMEQVEGVYGIIVNMNDYNTGADKGGAVNTFDDFDIDYNQQKYLMETRISGALVKPYSAIVLKKADKAAG